MVGDDYLTAAVGLKPQGVGEVHRIRPDIGVEVHPAEISDRIRLPEPPDPGEVVAALIVVDVVDEVDLAGVSEPVGAARAALAIFVVEDDPGVGAGVVASGTTEPRSSAW